MTQPIETGVHDQSDGAIPNFAIDQLLVGEQLIIWAFRKSLAGEVEESLPRGFKAAFGLCGVEAALSAFQGMYETIFRHCRQDLSFHRPRCRCVGGDEMIIVGLIAANQAGMQAQATSIARYLVQEAAVDDLLSHAESFSFMMESFNLHVPRRPLVCMAEPRQALVH